MTDLRARLEEALTAAAYPYAVGGGHALPIKTAVDVLLSLPGISVVDLPESDEYRWPVDGKFVEAREGLVWVPFQDVYEWPTIEAYHPRYARRLAVAILAAVEAAEREAK